MEFFYILSIFESFFRLIISISFFSCSDLEKDNLIKRMKLIIQHRVAINASRVQISGIPISMTIFDVNVRIPSISLRQSGALISRT